MTDTQKLIERLRKDYAESVIPPCHLCGAPLELHAFGGGRPSRWYCSKAKEHDDGKIAGKHFGDSLYEQIQHGDSDVIEMLDALEAQQQRIADLETERDQSRASANKLNRRVGELEHEKAAVARMAMRLSNSGDRHAGGKTAATVLAQELERSEAEVARLKALVP